jgi:lysozyme
LAFEREKWHAECEFRRQELQLRIKEQDRLRSELQFKIDEAKRSRWSSPLVLAIIGAGLAAVGNAGVNWLNSRDQRQLEDARALSAQHIQDETNKSQLALESFKADAGRLLEVIRTNDPDKAAVNLKFLLDAGLITNDRTAGYVKTFLATRSSGQGPVLPSPSSSPPIPRPGAVSSADLHRLLQSGLTLGVDVSHFNGTVDFAALRGRGVEFAYIRASQGATGVDGSLKAYTDSANQVGIKVGLYHVLTEAPADLQLKNFATLLASTQWDLPPAIDIVDAPGRDEGRDSGDFSIRVELLSRSIEDRFGTKPVLYTSQAFADAHLSQSMSAYPLWLVQYSRAREPRIPVGWSSYLFWQVADGVTDDAVLGSYDINVFKGGSRDLAALGARKK